MYEGHSINKLQNGIILLILKMWKFRNIHFLGIYFWVSVVNFITMTSLWRHL